MTVDDPLQAPLSNINWELEVFEESTHDFHHRVPEPTTTHRLWWERPPRPALILGSTQQRDLVDYQAAEIDNVEVSQRRSGGGLVYVDPATDCWIDVIIPAGSPIWDHDLGRTFHWLGRHWANVLRPTLPPTTPHLEIAIDSPPPRPPAERLIWCFADMGHGEVAIGGSKVVGLSQRRTRDWVRLQGLVLGSWPGADLDHYLTTDLDQLRPVDHPGQIAAGPPAGVTLPPPLELGQRFVDSLN